MTTLKNHTTIEMQAPEVDRLRRASQSSIMLEEDLRVLQEEPEFFVRKTVPNMPAVNAIEVEEVMDTKDFLEIQDGIDPNVFWLTEYITMDSIQDSLAQWDQNL